VKLVTNDYGCGTSSSILDYEIKDVVVVSETNFEHLFEQDDDLFLIGHDFLFYLWGNEDRIKKWIKYSEKHEIWLWCFERIDAIVPQWQQKSHFSLSIASKFCKRILACDEDDCDKYGFDWLPQWASKKFYDNRNRPIKIDKILFSGQAGIPEYKTRNLFLSELMQDKELSQKISITNTSRNMSWDQYIENLLQYNYILNPVGILKGMNTRAYESLYSGRFLFQHTAGNYKRHQTMLENNPGVLFFNDIRGFKEALKESQKMKPDSQSSYSLNSLQARMKSIGLEIK
jgi:hypothetical protein